MFACLQAALLSFQYDWVSMLKSDLGLSELGFRCLVFRRYDMQDDVELDEIAQRYATALRKKFDPNVVSDSVA